MKMNMNEDEEDDGKPKEEEEGVWQFSTGIWPRDLYT